MMCAGRKRSWEGRFPHERAMPMGRCVCICICGTLPAARTWGRICIRGGRRAVAHTAMTRYHDNARLQLA